MNLLFTEAYEKYLKYVELNQKKQSLRCLKERFNNKILPFFENYKLNEITRDTYIEFKHSLAMNDYSFNYLRNYHYLCVAFFDYCIEYLGLDKNVARIVGNFKDIGNHKIKNDFYTLKEFKKFIKKVDKYIYKEFFEFMFYTGTRPGEAMALKFSDLKYKKIDINKTIDEHGSREIGSTKTNSSTRIIGIDNILYHKLIKLKKFYKKKYNNFDEDFFIFGGIKPLAPTTLNRIKKIAAEKAKIKCIRLHDFRHSHATLLDSKNIKVKVISKRLGHSDISTTLNTYIHNDLKQEKRVIHTLNLTRFN